MAHVGAGQLRDRVAFDPPAGETDVLGGKSEAWGEGQPTAAQLIYQKGSEAVEAARLAGRQVFKVRVRSMSKTRAVTTDYRMRDVRRGNVYNIIEVDPITDRRWVYIVVEGPVVT